MLPVRRRESAADDVTKGLSVFVPGLMGAGVLLSIGVLIGDAIQRIRGDKGLRREIDLVADHIAEDVLRSIHRHHEVDRRRGLRSRGAYIGTAVGFLGLGFYGLVGSFWNYVNPVDDGWVEDIAWIWALSLIAVTSLLSIGGVLAHIALRYPEVPDWARRFLAHTPIGRVSNSTPDTPRRR